MKKYDDYKDNNGYKETIDLLEEASGLKADSTFKAKARVRLMDAVANEPMSAKVDRIRPRRMIIRTMAAIAALTLLITGVGFASTDSIPGDALYPVKRGIEEARLRATRNSEAKANIYLEIADRRLGESEKLKKLNRRERIEATLKLMTGNFAQAKALTNRVPVARRAVILRRLAEKQAQAEARKERILGPRQKNRLEQQKEIPLKPETKLQHFNNNNGNNNGNNNKGKNK